MYDYNFENSDECTEFSTKLKGYIESGNCQMVKDCLCEAFNTYSPEKSESHPCVDIIEKGFKLLKNNGWICLITYWKNMGMQLVIMNTRKRYFHSSYRYDLEGRK
jgi:hypothetical protein